MAVSWRNGSGHFLFWLQNLWVLLVLLSPSKTSLQPDAIFHNCNPKISVNPSSIVQTILAKYDMPYLYRRGLPGPEKAVFCLFSLCSEGDNEKKLNL